MGEGGVPAGRPFLNARGPATCLQTVAPTGISRRDSLPPLNAMPVFAGRTVCLAQTGLRTRRETADGGVLGRLRSVCGLSAGVRCCAPPAVADACPACAGQACQRKGFPEVFGRGNSKGRPCRPKVFFQRLVPGDIGSLLQILGENSNGLHATEQGPALRLYADGKNMVSDTKEPFPPCAVIFPECVP